MIDIVTTNEGFDALKPSWEALEKNSGMRIFQTYLWCRSAWDQYVSADKANRLWIMRWHQDGKDDQVIFPFFIDGKGCLRFVMDTHSDTLDVVYAAGFNHHTAFKEAVEAIMAEPAIKSVWLQKMFGTGEALNYFGVLLAGSTITKDHAFSWVEMCKSEDVFKSLDHLRSKDKVRFKGFAKKANEYEFRIVSKSRGDAFPRESIVNMRSQMIAHGTRANMWFCSDEMLDFIKMVYDKGSCEIPMLISNGETCALDFRLQKDDRTLAWIFLSGDPKTATQLYIRYAIERSKESDFVLDFGVGPYGWKLLTFRPKTAVTFSLRYGKSMWHELLMLKDANVRLLKDYLKHKLGVGHR